MYKLTGGKVNPLIGSAGVSAVPMAARVSQVEGQKANPANFLLMHAMGPNVAGVIGSGCCRRLCPQGIRRVSAKQKNPRNRSSFLLFRWRRIENGELRMENERGIRHFPLRYPNCVLPDRRGGQWPPVSHATSYRLVGATSWSPLRVRVCNWFEKLTHCVNSPFSICHSQFFMLS